MCGDAEICCERDFDIRKMGSALDAPCGIVIMSCYKKVNFRGGVDGELVAVMCDVVGLGVVGDVVASGGVERVFKSVE